MIKLSTFYEQIFEIYISIIVFVGDKTEFSSLNEH